MAFWPLWKWYVARMLDSSDEPWGLLALVTVGAILARERPVGLLSARHLMASACLMLAYAAAFPHLPYLVLGIIALTAVQFVVTPCFLGRAFHLGIWGLLMLSLPLVATLQFYLGYPLRVLTGICAAGVLRAGGMQVGLAGTVLSWAGEPVVIDAPCSGIRMLWAGLYLTFVLICIHRLRPRASVLLGVLAGVGLILGNAARTVALFFVETAATTFPDWVHPGAGIAVFLTVGLMIARVARTLEVRRCESAFSYS